MRRGKAFTFVILRYVNFLKKTFPYVLPLLTFSAILRRFLARFYFVSVLNAFGICEETKTTVNEINHTKKEKKSTQNKQFKETKSFTTKFTTSIQINLAL